MTDPQLKENETSKPFLDLNEPEDDAVKEWAKNNIGEDPDKKLEIIEEFRDMIYARGECNPHRTDDAHLLKFLRARHFIVRLAHRLITNYYNFKESTPEFFYNIEYDKLIELGYTHVINIPPYFDQEGRRLLIFRIGNWDTSKYSSDELFQAVILILEIALLEPRLQILGGVCIFDFQDLSIGQAWHMSPKVAKQVIQVAFSAIPVRVQAIHIVNHSWIFDIAFNMLKPFLQEVMKERIHFHENYESLHMHISPKHLPERYGGIHKDHSYNIWLDSLKDNDAIIEELTSLGYEGCREVVQKLKIRTDDVED